MNITIHIERLILDGLPVTSSQGPLVQAALEAELTRLLVDQGLRVSSAGAVPEVSAGSIQLKEHGKPAQLGHRIAQVVYGGLAPAPAPRLAPSRRGART